MACNCAARAKKLIGWLGFCRVQAMTPAGSDSPMWVVRYLGSRGRGFLYESDVEQHTTRSTIIAIILRITLGAPQEHCK